MLQSALFSTPSTFDRGETRPASPAWRSVSLPGKASLADLSAWLRSLVARDELRGMSAHLLRDIGFGGLD